MDNPVQNYKLKTVGINLYYGDFHALRDISMEILECSITAIIGPSGCGKSSLLRTFNRMNDLIPNARIEGEAYIGNQPIYGSDSDAVQIRKKIGMVFQKPNLFPTSIYNNIAIGPKSQGIKNKGDLDGIVEKSLRQVALFDDLKDRLSEPGLSLSSEQQQRLCIARALAIEPEAILMDESCSALDPVSTLMIEDLMKKLAENYAIIIVTHNMEQAVRVSDMAAFMMIGDDRAGMLVEYSNTEDMFSNPKDERTEGYITGRFG
ncbi:MAG: phosphate ABC transporter ATP-binding protein PstB [Eubacteriaceae bacterium]|nr:phosphate ABC transporter ATP-binding protein PstB [Eubacteriaceae bacterium]